MKPQLKFPHALNKKKKTPLEVGKLYISDATIFCWEREATFVSQCTSDTLIVTPNTPILYLGDNKILLKDKVRFISFEEMEFLELMK